MFPILYIDQMALDFPELVIVCGHVEYPWIEEMVAVACKYENVYIDASAYVIKRLPQKTHPLYENHYRTKQSLVRYQLPNDDSHACSSGVGQTRAQ
uniref:B229_C2_182 n=1 Tax=Mycobacterium leprae TaxID=1769 RepID=Q49860_MYCLR|nr:B229_C2_182 [Mycobacterium leprae]